MAAKKRKRSSDLPELIDDPTLGQLRFSVALDETDEYTAEVILEGQKVNLDLYTDSDGNLQTSIMMARGIIERFANITENIHRFIEQQIFPNFNDTWGQNKPPTSIDEIFRKLRLEHISIGPEAIATFWFDADDVFLWHCLQVEVNAQDEIIAHDMPG